VFKKFLLGLSLSLSAAALVPACDLGLPVPHEREVRDTYVGTVEPPLVRPHSPDGKPTPAIAYVKWRLVTSDGSHYLLFASDAVARQAEELKGKKVKVVAGQTISGLTVYEIKAAK
jgi:hypothetical protein